MIQNILLSVFWNIKKIMAICCSTIGNPKNNQCLHKRQVRVQAKQAVVLNRAGCGYSVNVIELARGLGTYSVDCQW
jgi:hypothetical protein